MTNQKHTLLICDDEEGVRESLNLILSGTYHIVFAANGAEALQLIESKKPSAVLMDIKMPKMNGLEVLKQIKIKQPEIPVVLITGYQSVEVAQEAIRLGASDYIPKPFESSHIQKIVAQILKSQ